MIGDKVDLFEMAKIILEKNYFEFNSEVYWQRWSTAVAAKFAPAFANIFLFNLETEMLNECSVKPWVFWKVFDDIFFICLHGEEGITVKAYS